MADSFPQTDKISVNNHLVGYSHNTIYAQQNRNLMVSASNYQLMHSPHSQMSHFPLGHEYGSQQSLNLNVPLGEFVPNVNNSIVKNEIKTEIKVEPDPSTSHDLPAYYMPEPQGEVDVQIKNMSCRFCLPMHIDLRRLALSTINVVYDRSKGKLTMQRRRPACHINIYSSGVVVIVGCKTENDCKKVARKVGRMIQRVMGKAHDKIRMRNYQVKNILATCSMPFGINILEIAKKYPKQAAYEPELFVGLEWTSTDPKANLRIYTTGTIIITGATSEADVMRVLEFIYEIVVQHRCIPASKEQERMEIARKRQQRKRTDGLSGLPIKRQRTYNTSRETGMIGNKMYFDDEDEDLLYD